MLSEMIHKLITELGIVHNGKDTGRPDFDRAVWSAITALQELQRFL